MGVSPSRTRRLLRLRDLLAQAFTNMSLSRQLCTMTEDMSHTATCPLASLSPVHFTSLANLTAGAPSRTALHHPKSSTDLLDIRAGLPKADKSLTPPSELESFDLASQRLMGTLSSPLTPRT